MRVPKKRQTASQPCIRDFHQAAKGIASSLWCLGNKKSEALAEVSFPRDSTNASLFA